MSLTLKDILTSCGCVPPLGFPAADRKILFDTDSEAVVPRVLTLFEEFKERMGFLSLALRAMANCEQQQSGHKDEVLYQQQCNRTRLQWFC